MFLRSRLSIVLFLKEILSCSWDLITRMNIDGLLLKRQGAEGIAEKQIEFFVNVLLDLFSKNFVLPFLLKFELVFYIPARGKDSDIS
jgi:hypothetical protein